MPYVGAATAVATLAYGVYSGERASDVQGKARKQQAQDQKKAESQAISASRKADEANRAANQKRPDVGSLLTAEQSQALTGAGSTLLTGPSGVDANKLKLGKASLLGS